MEKDIINSKYNSTKKSYGLMCFRYTNKFEVLLVQRRISYGFYDFVIGKYNIQDMKKLTHLFNNMTNDEKITILSFVQGKVKNTCVSLL